MNKRFSKTEALPAPQHSLANRIAFAILGLTQVVCPLLFFTNLTRNPYYTQIALLNVFIAIASALWAVECLRTGEWRLPRVSFEIPLAVFLVVALASTLHSWHVHLNLRPGIAYEGTRIWVFTLVNGVMAFYLPMVFLKPLGDDSPRLSIWSDILLASVWGLAWLGFHTMKSNDPSLLMWDPYGGFLWILACVYAVVRTRRGEAEEMFHVILAVTLLSGAYGLLQYFRVDCIWSSIIQPYGGRPVSSFGNPNFLSSYLMLGAPLALGFALRSRGSQSVGFYFISLIAIVSVLCTLTRSSYVGLLVSFLAMAISIYKKENLPIVKRVAIFALAVVVLVIVYPKTPVTGVQSPLGRFTEIFQAAHTGQSYGPWHQRILIWSSAWEMVRERVLLGKGWGCFELFYPFYQGVFIMNPAYAQWRTHANNAHNVVMEMWSQVGTLGAGAALWLFVTLFFGGWFILKERCENQNRFVVAGLLAGFVGMVFDNFFGNVSIFFAVPAFLFYWNMGSLYNETKSVVVFRRPVKIPGRVFLVLTMGVCALVSVYFFRRWKQELYYFEGFKYSKNGDMVNSYKSLEKAFDWFGGEVNSNYEMGNSYARYGKTLLDNKRPEESHAFTEKAIRAYQASLAANPGYDEIYFNLGITQAQMGSQAEAIKNIRTALLINPLLREGYGALGSLYLNTNEVAKAVVYYEQGVALFPTDKEMWNNLGFFYNKINEDEKSLVAYRHALQIDPAFQQAWQNLSVTANKLHRREPLLEAPELVQRMNDLYAQKKFAEAKKVAERMVELMPENPDVHLSLGNLLYYLGDIDGSIVEINKAISLRRNFEQAYSNLGHIYRAQKKYDLARENYEKAIDINGNDEDTKKALESLPR